MQSDPDLLVLHALRLKGFADAPAVASFADMDEVDVAGRLEQAAGDGLATYREGRITGWALTAAGRARHKDALANELSTHPGARETVDRAYRQFLAINGELLAVCTDWQLRDGALNDHSDERYDANVIDRLAEIDGVVQPICASLAGALARFGGYGSRLSAALARVRDGETDWIAKPVIDSYHTVWFELHEDLLVTLGLERSKEGTG